MIFTSVIYKGQLIRGWAKNEMLSDVSGWGGGGGWGVGVSKCSGRPNKTGVTPWPDIMLSQTLIYYWQEIFLIPLFKWTTSVVYILKLRLWDYGCTPQEPTSSHVHRYSYLYLQKVVIGRFLNLLFDSAGEIL